MTRVGLEPLTKGFSVPRFACFALRGFESGSLATSIIWPRFCLKNKRYSSGGDLEFDSNSATS
jgi:hypothetical protein